MKLLSFLGTGNYQETTYFAGNRECRTNIFPLAVVEWLKPSEAIFLLTKEAKAHKNWTDLQAKIPKSCSVTSVDIPIGKSETEFWEIFKKLTESLSQSNDEIVFDITHGFRSLPILGLLAAAYLRVASSIKLKAVLYGAFEAKDETTNRTPVFDLTPFLQMQNWAIATDKFIKDGNAKEIANLLKLSPASISWNLETISTVRESSPIKFQQLATSLENLSIALNISRPTEIAFESKRIIQKLEDSTQVSSEWIQPFELLRERVIDTYSDFREDDLVSQRKLIKWFAEHGKQSQAILLAREWLISWAGNKINENDRDIVCEYLNNRCNGANLLKNLAEWRQVEKVWIDVRDFRNDLAHYGIGRRKPKTLQEFLTFAKKISETLEKFEVD